MRGLAGDLTTMPLKDLVVYLGNRKASGTLTLEREGVRKQLILREGMIVDASSNEPREFLGQFLINLGHITEDQFTKAFQTQKETRVFIGKILTMIGLVSEETVMSALSLKFRETLLDALAWTSGEFSFEPGQPPAQPDGVDLHVDLLDVQREGEFRQTAWQTIRAAFPSGRVRLEVVEANLPERPKPGSLDERLIALIKAGQTIEEMVLALHATDFFVYQRLYALHRLEAVRVLEEPLDIEVDEPLVEAEEPPTEEDALSRASAHLAAGEPGPAEALARKAHAEAPTPENEALLRRAEAALLTQLRRALLDGGRIAHLQVPPAKLKALKLSAPERYLLSRIDGTRDLASIVHVSPLRELDALKYLQRFVDSDLIRLQ